MRFARCRLGSPLEFNYWEIIIYFSVHHGIRQIKKVIKQNCVYTENLCQVHILACCCKLTLQRFCPNPYTKPNLVYLKAVRFFFAEDLSPIFGYYRYSPTKNSLIPVYMRRLAVIPGVNWDGRFAGGISGNGLISRK